jgi:hypothetical protein
MTIGKRHLAYHLCPFKKTNVWRNTLEQLSLRQSLFNGVRVVAVATGDDIVTVDESTDYINSTIKDCHIITFDNQSNLREVASWNLLFDYLLPKTNDTDVVFYAHGKGVTRNDDPGNTCHWWNSLLYSVYLDHWAFVKQMLSDKPIAGAFKKIGRGFGTAGGQWHYSGGFFWARINEFRKRYETVEPRREWWGVESWPGLAYPQDDAATLFMTGRVPVMDLYRREYWERFVRPEFEKWILQRRHESELAAR